MPPLYAHDPFLLLQHALTSPWLDRPMALASMGCEGWAIALIAAVFVISQERDPGRAGRAVVPLVAGLLLAGLAAQLLKRAVDVPRPLAVLGAAHVHLLLEPLRARSFPSGHAASAAALAVFATLHYRARAWPLWILAVVGGLSRVYVGAHWTLDVAAGWAVGAVAVVAVEAALARLRLRDARLGGTAAAAQ